MVKDLMQIVIILVYNSQMNMCMEFNTSSNSPHARVYQRYFCLIRNEEAYNENHHLRYSNLTL